MKRAALFSHVQRNNLKSLALLILFLLLIEASHVAIRLVPVATNVSWTTRLNPAASFDNVEVRSGGTESVSRGWGIVVKSPSRNDGFATVWRKYMTEGTLFQRDWILILVVGLAYIALACWRSVVFMRYETGARVLERKDAPELYNLVENLAISIGLPCPRIELIESDKLNAYAAGFFPENSSIGVTRGLIRRLSRDEIEAVLAHELVHIRDRDVRLMVVARACVDLTLPISRRIVNFGHAHPFVAAFTALQLLYLLGLSFAMILVAIMATIALLAIGVRFVISQTREFTADAGAIELTKNPAALVTALWKVAVDDDLPLIGCASRAMMFSASADSFWERLIGSHPSVQARVDAIMLHGAVVSRDLQLGPASWEFKAENSPQSNSAIFGRRRVVHGFSGFQGLGASTNGVETTYRRSNPVFGQRGASSDLIDPGHRRIAEPVIVNNMEPVAARESRFSDWVVGHKADVVTNRIAGVFEGAFVAWTYYCIGTVVVGIAFVLVLIKPLLFVPFFVFAVWLYGKYKAR